VQKLLEEYDEKPYNLISEGQYQLDLKHLNAIILEKSGVPKHQIDISTYCTSCHDDLFYSHRRDKGRTGRLMSFIGWKEE
jgi:copper oxidase (laccase) domain-containing protein